MTIRDILESGIEFQSDVMVKSYDYDLEDYSIAKPLFCAEEYYDLPVLYIYQNGDEIVIEVEREE